VVYEEPYEIEKLTKTELITIVAQVFKLKVLCWTARDRP
jgi:hypothetical protein